MRKVHYAVEVLYGCVAQPACEQGRDAIADAGRDTLMTEDVAEVSCKRCLKALGFDPVPVEQMRDAVGNPLARAA